MMTGSTPKPHPADVELVRRHAEYSSEVTEFLDAARLAVRSPGDVVLLALASRVIQIAHTIQELCERGHGGEAAPLGRAVLSGTVALMALVEERKDGLARSFVQSVALSTTRIDRIGEAMGMSQRAVRELGAQLRGTSDANLAAFTGIESAKIGHAAHTWHGLPTERDLFVHVGMTTWYDVFYTTFSDEAHVGARALSAEAAEVQRHEIGFGPKWAARLGTTIRDRKVPGRSARPT